MRKLLYSVCVLLIINTAALAQWDGWKNLKNPTFTTMTVTGAAIFQGTVTITGTVTMSQAMTSTSSITLTRATLDTVRFMGAGGAFIEVEDNNVSTFIVASDNKIGIGKAVPTFGLDVEHASGFNFKDTTYDLSIETGTNVLKLRDIGSAADIVLYDGGDGSLTLRTVANADIALIPNGSGNIGINIAAPLRLLDVAGSTRIKGTGTVTLTGTIDPAASTTVDGVGTLFLTELVIGDQLVVTGENRTVTAIASDIECTVDAAFTDNANDTTPDKIESHLVITDSGGTTDLVVDADGNVGIGMASPGNKLEVNGAVTTTRLKRYNDTSDNTYLRFDEDKITLHAGGKDFFVGLETTQDVVKLGNGTDVDINLNDMAFIEGSSGNVGIGTTAPGGNLTIDGNQSATNLLEIINDDDGSAGDSSLVITKLGEINKPAGNMVFDVASGSLLSFREAGNGLRIDGSGQFIRGDDSLDLLDFNAALWQTATADMKIDPDEGSVGVLQLGDTGDNDTTRVVGEFDVSNDISGDADSTIQILTDASISKPAGDLQFDVASGATFIFGEAGSDGIFIDASIDRITGSDADNFIDFDLAKWQTDASDMVIDPDLGAVGILQLGDTGDNDTVKVVGVIELNDAALHAPDYAGVSVNNNGSATDIALVDAWEKYLFFDTNSPEAVSDGDNTSNDITIGATGVYDIRFYLSGSSANVNKVFEYTIFELNATATAITAATAADPVVITASGHGFSNGNKIAIKVMDDMVEVNDRIFTVQDVSGATFELTDDGGTSPGDDIDGTGFTPYVSGGTVQLVTELDVHSHRKYAVANDIGHAGGGNFASLTASRTLELYMKNVTDDDNPTLENVILLMKRID